MGTIDRMEVMVTEGFEWSSLRDLNALPYTRTTLACQPQAVSVCPQKVDCTAEASA